MAIKETKQKTFNLPLFNALRGTTTHHTAAQTHKRKMTATKGKTTINTTNNSL